MLPCVIDHEELSLGHKPTTDSCIFSLIVMDATLVIVYAIVSHMTCITNILACLLQALEQRPQSADSDSSAKELINSGSGTAGRSMVSLHQAGLHTIRWISTVCLAGYV